MKGGQASLAAERRITYRPIGGQARRKAAALVFLLRKSLVPSAYLPPRPWAYGARRLKAHAGASAPGHTPRMILSRSALLLLLLAGGRAGAEAPPVPPPVAARPALNVVLMGPPGGGTGTQAARIVAEFGVVHISAGDVLRERAKTDPALAEIMNRGELVPLGIVVPLIEERLTRADARQRGFALDGFPRRLSDAEAVMAILGRGALRIDAVLRLEVPEEELLRRVLARGRQDDTEATFRNRMRVYREQTGPVYGFLRDKLPLVELDANGSEDEVYRRVRAALLRVLAARP